MWYIFAYVARMQVNLASNYIRIIVVEHFEQFDVMDGLDENIHV